MRRDVGPCEALPQDVSDHLPSSFVRGTSWDIAIASRSRRHWGDPDASCALTEVKAFDGQLLAISHRACCSISEWQVSAAEDFQTSIFLWSRIIPAFTSTSVVVSCPQMRQILPVHFELPHAIDP